MLRWLRLAVLLFMFPAFSAFAQSSLLISSLVCNPSTLQAGFLSSCTVTLNGVAPADTSVSLTSSNAVVYVQGVVVVPAGYNTASFTAYAAGYLMEGLAILTATLNGSSVTTTFALVGTTLTFASLTCDRSVLQPGASTVCTLTASGPAPLGGAQATLTTSDPILTVPAIVTIPAGATTVTFTATASANGSNPGVVLTATRSGVSVSVTIPVLGVPPTLVSFTCNPALLAGNSSGSCAVGIYPAAPAGGVVISISSDNALLTVPGSVIVNSGSLSATFAVFVGTVANNQNATLTATFNNSSLHALLSLVTPPALAAVSCTDRSLTSGAATTCTVTLTKPALSGGATVSISSDNPALIAPAFLTVPADATTATFTIVAGTVKVLQNATVTASFNGISVSFVFALTVPVGPVGIACTSTQLTSGSATTCTVILNQPAPAGGTVVALASSTPLVSVPASVTVPASGTAASFTAAAGAITAADTAVLTATMNGASSSISLTLSPSAPPGLTSLVCAPVTLAPGASSTCTMTLSAPPAQGLAVSVATTSDRLRIPNSVTIPQGSQSVTFAVTAQNASHSRHPKPYPLTIGLVTATLDGVTLTQTIVIQPADGPSTYRPAPRP